MTDQPVSDWLGAQFALLHPQLQSLHRDGGVLHGAVDIVFGRSLAGVFGRRLARRLGIPDTAGTHALEVDISHDGAALYWDRRFDQGSRMASVFRPVGHWPEGYWLEQTGPIELRLSVDVLDGGWYWRLLGAKFRGIPLPLWLLPQSKAYKRIENGSYRFQVGFSLPLFGLVLSYGGLLTAKIGD